MYYVFFIADIYLDYKIYTIREIFKETLIDIENKPIRKEIKYTIQYIMEDMIKNLK